MNFDFMRVVDRYAGSVVLQIIYLIVRLFDLIRTSNISAENVKTIVFQKYFGVGSIINAIPAINSVGKSYPNAKIVFVSFKSQEGFLRHIDLIDLVIIIDDKNFWRFCLTSMSSLIKLWKLHVDICIDFEFFSRFSMIISALSGARIRAGFFALSNPRSNLLTHPSSFNHYTHISRSFKALAEVIGANINNNEESVPLKKFGAQCAMEVNELIGGNYSSPIVTVNISTSSLCDLRAWPDIYFAQLLELLTENYPLYRFVMIGTMEQKHETKNVVSLMSKNSEHVIDIAGKTDFKLLMALLENSSMLITNDGGPAHIAAAYETPTIVLFGPETPVIYRPLSNYVIVHYKPPFCSPCMNVLDNKNFETCYNTICLNSITVDDVYKSATKILSKATDCEDIYGPSKIIKY